MSCGGHDENMRRRALVRNDRICKLVHTFTFAHFFSTSLSDIDIACGRNDNCCGDRKRMYQKTGVHVSENDGLEHDESERGQSSTSR